MIVNVTENEARHIGEKRYENEFKKHFLLSMFAFSIIPPVVIIVLLKLGMKCDKCKIVYLGLSILFLIPMIIIGYKWYKYKKIAGDLFIKNMVISNNT